LESEQTERVLEEMLYRDNVSTECPEGRSSDLNKYEHQKPLASKTVVLIESLSRGTNPCHNLIRLYLIAVF
jgi:hypothetical protein